MFTRRGKYVVRKLPANVPVGSATTLLDAADVAMEDARRGPGKWVIEQPVIEVDVSKAYGVLAVAAAVPETPGEMFLLGVGVTDASIECSAVPDSTGYQWYLSGVPYQVTATASVYISGLLAATSYAVQVAALRDGVSSAVSSPVAFTTLEMEPPVWQAVPAQDLTVGAAFDLDLAAYAISPGGDVPAFSVVSGYLPAGLSIVGTRITGTPGAVETQTPVIRATAAGGTADSAAITMESLNADVTAPDAPTNFSAAGYSSSQVRLAWTNPSGDAVVAGARTSGFQGVDVYRDGVKIDRVLASSASPEEYLADTTVTALWKVRSLDFVTPNPNKGAFTAELSAGPLAQSTAPGVPVSVAAVRNSATSATVTWAAGSGPAPTSYQVWMALSLNGTYTQVGSPAGTSHTQTTGFTGSQVPYFYVVAVRGAETSAPSATVAASLAYLGTVTEYFATSFEGADPTTDGMVIWSPVGHDAYDPAVDNMVEHSALKAYHGGKSLRVQLTAHRWGSNDFPQDDVAHLPITPAPTRNYRKDGGDIGQQIAHRNELKWPSSGNFLIPWDREEWIGFAVRLPGPNDPHGDWPWRPVSWWSYSVGPQLHSAVGGPGPPLTLKHGSASWPKYANSLAGIPWPVGAPHVRYKRGSDAYDPNTSAFLAESTSAAKLRVEWDAVAGASTYRVYRSVRSQGPWTEITASGGSITLDKALRRYSEDDLGTNLSPTTNQRNAYIYVTAIVGGVERSPSFICPSGRHYWGIGGYGASGVSVEATFGNALDDLGTWVRFVIRYKLSTTGDGYVQAWKNGVEVVWMPSTNLGHSLSSYHYWRMGIYTNVPTENYSLDPLIAADWAAREIVYYDALRMAKRAGGSNLRTDAGDPGYIAVDPERY